MSSLRLVFIISLAAFFIAGLERRPASGGECPVYIVDFSPASGSYKSGDKVISSVTFKNSAAEKKSFWVGYSVCDASSVWHDAPYTGPVVLSAGSVSGPVKLLWNVPDDSSFPSGNFLVRMALWNAPPDSKDPVRYLFVDREKAFYALNANLEKFSNLGGIGFKPTPDTSKPVRNRGKLLFKNVLLDNDEAEIVFNAKKFDGGQIESCQSFSHGTFSIELKTCRAAKSVTGFFLYDPVSEDEITMEIFNDGSRRLWLTSYISSGDPLEKIEAILPFDPSERYHSYTISYLKEKIFFYADGVMTGTIENSGDKKKVPAGSKMKMMVNSWFPGWKDFRPFSDKDMPVSKSSTHIKNPAYIPLF